METWAKIVHELGVIEDEKAERCEQLARLVCDSRMNDLACWFEETKAYEWLRRWLSASV